jgi:predicted phosphodiesterase
MRVFAISDVHTDFPENVQLLDGLSTTGYREDALILAGDVSHDLTVVRRTLEGLLERFRYLFFVPGNHELWVRNGGQSLEKFHTLLGLCERLGVLTGPKCIGSGEDRVCVVPLFSWYTRPEEGSDTLFRERRIEDPGSAVWTDDYLIKWPPGFRPTPFFLGLNEPRVSVPYEASVISFSHFMPRADLMFAIPGEDPQLHSEQARHFNFSRVAGSTLIEDQIRRLGSKVHVYGHQHRNRCRQYEGVWYVSNCLGYRDERRGRGDLPIVKEISTLPGGAPGR